MSREPWHVTLQCRSDPQPQCNMAHTWHIHGTCSPLALAAGPRDASKDRGSLFQNVRPNRADSCLLKAPKEFNAKTSQLQAKNLRSLAAAAFRKWQIHGPLAQHPCRGTSLKIGELAAIVEGTAEK